jgi:hypothetical protein
MEAGGGADGPRTIGDVIGERLLGVLEAEEEKLDRKLQALEDMDEDDVERLRARRLDQMKKFAKQKSEWLANGHGEYRECDDQKRFFDELRAAPRAVIHFYRPSTRRCEIIDKHFYALAPKHIETKFLRVNAERSPFLAERLHIWMLPTIVCCRDGKTDHSIQCVAAAAFTPRAHARISLRPCTHVSTSRNPRPATLPRRSAEDLTSSAAATISRRT